MGLAIIRQPTATTGMEVLNRIAWGDQGQIVYAKNAVRKGKYACPDCKEQLIFRRSDDLTKKGAKRPHFAHVSGTSVCTPETILHEAFKKSIHDRLKEAIAEGKTVPIQWTCTHCHQVHERDLVSTAVAVEMEYDMKTARADVSLINKKNETVAAIEVVVTHAPEPGVIEFYKKQKIVLVRFDIHEDQDLSRASEPILTPDHVDYCPGSKRCTDCGEYKEDMVMEIWEVTCGQCGETGKAAYLYAGADRLSLPATPEYFTADEIKQAKAGGANIRARYNWILEKEACANSCRKCDTPFSGPWHPLARGQNATLLKEVPKEIQIGMYCEACTDHRSLKKINQRLGGLGSRLAQIKEPEGPFHCIRCKASVGAGYLYCTKCFESWSRYRNENYPERFCHECGEPWQTSKADCRCTSCKKKWGKRQYDREPLVTERERLFRLKQTVKHRDAQR
ncbi:MAG: hypothetical protein WBO28_01800 [Flavobacteriales bacterium]